MEPDGPTVTSLWWMSGASLKFTFWVLWYYRRLWKQQEKLDRDYAFLGSKNFEVRNRVSFFEGEARKD